MIDALYHPIARTITDVLAGEEHAAELFLIDDEENILMAVRHGVQLECVVHTGSEGQGLSQELQEALGESAVPVHEMAVHVAKKLFGREKRTRLFALARKPDPAALADLAGAQGDIVVLDGVKLAGNIGAISRTACALGAAGLVLVESGLQSVLDRRLVRASRGTVFALPMVLAERSAVLSFLAEHHVVVAGLDAGSTRTISEIAAVPGQLAIVMGSERRGPSKEFEEVTENWFSIPMNPAVESLNVSVAAGIALYLHSSGGAGR